MRRVRLSAVCYPAFPDGCWNRNLLRSMAVEPTLYCTLWSLRRGTLGGLSLVSRHEEFDADNGGMEHYKVTLSEQERSELQGIAGKGTHAASKLINALILLNCDHSGGRTERARTCDIAAMLCVSERKVDRIQEEVCPRRPGPDPEPPALQVRVRLVDRWPPGGAAAGAELLGTARRPGPLVAAAAGRPSDRARID